MFGYLFKEINVERTQEARGLVCQFQAWTLSRTWATLTILGAGSC
jgi:hypothetical protein